MNKQLNLRKYFIMGSQNCTRDPITILQEAINGGITAFQFREKGKNALLGKDKIKLGKQLREICRESNIPFFINDDVELANVLEVDGIHVGQDDTSVELIREKFPNVFVGLSVSNLAELQNSNLSIVDYVGAGPVFATNTKEDAKQVVGTNWIKKLRQLHPTLPIVGIGGITEQNSHEVLQAGADGVAFISAVTRASDVKRAIENL